LPRGAELPVDVDDEPVPALRVPREGGGREGNRGEGRAPDHVLPHEPAVDGPRAAAAGGDRARARAAGAVRRGGAGGPTQGRRRGPGIVRRRGTLKHVELASPGG